MKATKTTTQPAAKAAAKTAPRAPIPQRAADDEEHARTMKAGRAATQANLPAVRGKTDVGAALDWEQELAKRAQRSAKVADAVAGGGSWLTFKGGRLAYKNLEIKDNEIELVILDEVLENLFYEGRYDPDSPASPVCFALARELGDLKPHATAPDPQHETCRGCPQNEFGTSDTGKGKACKNVVRLAFIAYGDGSREQLETCELAFAKLPVTSTKNWASYTKSLREKAGAAPFGFVTRLAVEPNSKTQFQVVFDAVKPLDRKLGNVVLQRVLEAEKAIIPEQPYQQIEQREPPPPPARGGRNAKQPARRAKY